VLGGCNTNLQQQCLQITRLQNSSFPLTYLGVPITASRLTKIECASLVEKIIARVHLWAARNISFAGRARLINSVILECSPIRPQFFCCQMKSHRRSIRYAGTTYGVELLAIRKHPTFPGIILVNPNLKGE